jgi:hypothetical protein
VNGILKTRRRHENIGYFLTAKDLTSGFIDISICKYKKGTLK